MDFSKYTKLRTGIISNEQLAEWFGTKEKTIRNNKEKFLRELNGYCIYEYIDNKLNIIKILDNNNIYYYRNKVLEKALTAKFIKYWNPAGYDTTERLLEETYSASFNCSREEALIMYNYIKCKLYGSPTMDIKGEKGYCQKCLCIKKSSEKFPIPLDIIQ